MSICIHSHYRRKWKRPQPETHDPAQLAVAWKLKEQPADEIDRGLYNNRPARLRAARIGEVMKQFVSKLEARKVQDMILPNLTHRMEFTQRGRIPEMEECLSQAPSDGRYIARAAWMGEDGIGHVYLAWKEKPTTVPTETAESANISISNPSEGGKA